MRGVKVFLFITFIFMAAYGLADLFFPAELAETGLGQEPVRAARHVAVVFLALAGAAWYAFRNPRKNVAVVRAIIAFYVLDALVGLIQGATGVEDWGPALTGIIVGVVMAGGLSYFYPRGEKAA